MASVRYCAALDVPIYTRACAAPLRVILCCTGSYSACAALHMQITVYKGFCAASGRNKPKNLIFGFHETNWKQPKQIEFQFVSVWTDNIFCLFRGHSNKSNDTVF
jgi:hypothetical protein